MNPKNLNFQSQGKGQALLLLHGALLSSNMWEPQVRALSPHFQVITLDLPAHAKSPDLKGKYSIKGLAQSVASVLDTERVAQTHICGHSLGGMVAQQIAIQRPDLATKLVLAESAFGTRNTLWEKLQTAFSKPFLRVLSAKGLVELSVNQYGKLNAEVGEFIREEMSAYEKTTALRIMGAAFDYSGKQALITIQAPTLVLAAQENKQTHAQARIMAEVIPDARLLFIPEASHMLNLDNPEGFNTILLNFLQSTPNS